MDREVHGENSYIHAVGEQYDRRGRRVFKSNYDGVLLVLVVLLGVFGLVMIYSSSFYTGSHYYHDSMKFFYPQAIIFAVGFVLMLVVSTIDYRLYITPVKWLFRIRPIWLLYLLCVILQVFVILKGITAGGSNRWIPIGNYQFQPSELTKICIVLFTSYIVTKIGNNINKISGFLGVAIYVGALIATVAYENLSTALIFCIVFCAICFTATKNKRYYWIVVLIGIVFAAVFVLIKPYRIDRIVNWFNGSVLEEDTQILEGLYAIASGGLLGKGLGASSQKLGAIDEVHTDMIFSIVCEELGIIGAIMIVLVVLMLMWRLMNIALNAPDMFGSLIAVGIMVQIALQAFLNIAVVTASMPATGITFPFLSYGGSSLLTLMIEMGLALSVSKYTDKEAVAHV